MRRSESASARLPSGGTSSPSFAERLAELIATLQDLGELGTALAPRRWLSRYRSAQAAPVRYIAPRERLAAADGEARGETFSIDLGAIPGLAGSVNACLELSGQEVVLRVDAECDLKEVRFGTGVSHSAGADGSWTARAPRTTTPIALRVEDRNGAVFEDELVLDAER